MNSRVRWLEEALTDGFRILPMLEGHGGPLGPLPGLDRLRDDQRYRRLEARLAAARDSMREIVERQGC